MRTPPGKGGVAETIERHFETATSTATARHIQPACDLCRRADEHRRLQYLVHHLADRVASDCAGRVLYVELARRGVNIAPEGRP